MSEIIFDSIDELFPIAGIENDSQGFRDNYNIIKTSLGIAKSEIEALELSTAKLTTNNDFNGNTIRNATLSEVYGTVRNYTAQIIPQSAVDISLTDGEFHNIVVSGNTLLTFKDWPAPAVHANIRITLTSNTSIARTVTFGTINSGIFKKITSEFGSTLVPLTVIPASGNSVVIDAWTIDGGNTVYLKYIGEFV